jgi:hypothetical protein
MIVTLDGECAARNISEKHEVNKVEGLEIESKGRNLENKIIIYLRKTSEENKNWYIL